MRTKKYEVYETTKELSDRKQPILKRTLIGIYDITVAVNNQNLTNDIRFVDATHTVIVPKQLTLRIAYEIKEVDSEVVYSIIYPLEEGSIYRSYYAKVKE